MKLLWKKVSWKALYKLDIRATAIGTSRSDFKTQTSNIQQQHLSLKLCRFIYYELLSYIYEMLVNIHVIMCPCRAVESCNLKDAHSISDLTVLDPDSWHSVSPLMQVSYISLIILVFVTFLYKTMIYTGYIKATDTINYCCAKPVHLCSHVVHRLSEEELRSLSEQNWQVWWWWWAKFWKATCECKYLSWWGNIVAKDRSSMDNKSLCFTPAL